MPTWRCVLCGDGHGQPRPQAISREGLPCSSCGATWRVRATVVALLYGLEIQPKPLPDVGEDWSRRGIGCSDHHALAARLPSRVTYTNTYFERYPLLNILRPPTELLGALTFAICSDVMEHVEPPHQRGFDGLFSILRPGGFAVVTVPVFDEQETAEFYPAHQDFEVLDGSRVRWRDDQGREFLDESPEMHEGEGQVLVFRRFVPGDVVSGLHEAGFMPVWEPPVHPELGVFEIARPGVFLARKP